METLRDIIFEDIKSDYNNKGEDSVLYRFLREKKRAEKIKKNKKESVKGETVVRDVDIHKVATDFMYNHGYPLAKGKSKNVDYATGDIREKETERKSTNNKEEKISRLPIILSS